MQIILHRSSDAPLGVHVAKLHAQIIAARLNAMNSDPARRALLKSLYGTAQLQNTNP